jgi:hypothetical protein
MMQVGDSRWERREGRRKSSVAIQEFDWNNLLPTFLTILGVQADFDGSFRSIESFSANPKLNAPLLKIDFIQ